MAKLTDKQKRFIHEYIICANGSEAARRAGYSKRTANRMASENLAKPHIKAEIDRLLQEKEDALIARADEVLKYLTAVMRGEEVEEIVGFTETGAERVEKLPYVKDRVKAAELLGKRYALFSDNVNLAGEVGVKIVDDIPEDDAE